MLSCEKIHVYFIKLTICRAYHFLCHRVGVGQVVLLRRIEGDVALQGPEDPLVGEILGPGVVKELLRVVVGVQRAFAEGVAANPAFVAETI